MTAGELRRTVEAAAAADGYCRETVADVGEALWPG